MTPDMITAGCALIALIGGGIWALFQFFATKDQTKALFSLIKELKAEMQETRDMARTAISNQVYYQKAIDDYKKVIDNNDATLKNVEGLFMELARRKESA